MTNAEKRAELIQKAEVVLARRPYSKMDEAEFKSLIDLADAFADGPRRERVDTIVSAELRKNEDETEMQFRSYARKPENRTYTAMNESTGGQGGFFVPEKWNAAYQLRLASSSGLLKAGATVVDSPAVLGRPFLSFFSDDVANEASIVPENQAITASNPVAAVKSPVTVKFGTSSTVSSELVQDAAFNLDDFLQSLFGTRVSRKFNNWATTDATNGIIPQLATLVTGGSYGATSSSSSLPSETELAAMQSQVDDAYMEADSAPVYMMNNAMRVALMQARDSNGARMFPEIARNNSLLGFPIISNVDMSVAAGSLAVVFGSVKRAVLVQKSRPTFMASVERYAEFGQMFYLLTQKLGVKLVDQNAVTALALHS